MAAVYKDGRFAEIAVDEALQPSAVAAANRLAQPGHDGPHQRSPVGDLTRAQEPELTLTR